MAKPTVARVLTNNESIASKACSMQRLVDSMLQRLDAAGIPYCLLRNRERIPHDLLGWTDLDLLVSNKASRDQVIALFADLEPALVAPIRRGFTALFFPVEDHFLRVDLFNGDVEWRAAAYGINEEILSQRWNDDGIMVASLLHQAFVAWFSRLLRYGEVSTRYLPLITETMRAEPAAFRQLLERTFGTSLADRLVTLALTDRVLESEALTPQLRRMLWVRSLRRRPFSTVGRYISQLGDALDHRIRPAGLDVALLGPDGTGKTSLCATISELPSRKVPFGNTKYRKLYHRVLPPMGVIKSRMLHRPRLQRDASNPHGTPPLHPLVWFGSNLYYTVDQWLSELTWNRQKLAHMNLVLRDRHPMEVVIDPKRYRYAGPKVLAKCIASLSPKPDLYIILDAPTEVIQARKQDVSFEETSRQMEEYRALARRLPNAYIVDATQPFDQVMRDVISIISKVTASRTRKRFRLENLVKKQASAPARMLRDVSRTDELAIRRSAPSSVTSIPAAKGE